MVNIFLYYNYAPFLMLQAYIMPLTLSKMKFEKKKKKKKLFQSLRRWKEEGNEQYSKSKNSKRCVFYGWNIRILIGYNRTGWTSKTKWIKK
jgi:hypothetical protein